MKIYLVEVEYDNSAIIGRPTNNIMRALEIAREYMNNHSLRNEWNQVSNIFSNLHFCDYQLPYVWKDSHATFLYIREYELDEGTE